MQVPGHKLYDEHLKQTEDHRNNQVTCDGSHNKLTYVKHLLEEKL